MEINLKDNLSAALARAQATMLCAQKTGYNPHFKSSFSTLEDLVSASRESLTREGLSVVQFRDFEGDNDFLVTQLRHSSGEMIPARALIYLKEKTDIQKLGSAISYLKRYEYAAICGIATSDSDDDGNSAVIETILTDKQLAYIRSLLKGQEDRESKMCAHYGIDSLSKLPARCVQEVLNTLKPRE